jgi:membrane-bound metal-dependent hydrolase YbcI (DUF457 family)
MFLFGHAGITAALARAGDAIFPENTDKGAGFRSGISRIMGKLRNRHGKIDYRMVIIGSLLPDIIDKSTFLLAGAGNGTLSGRDFAHSLLFSVLLFAGGLFLLRYRKPWLLLLSLGNFVHLLLDRIWDMPDTLFWPFLGPLEGRPSANWLSERWHDLLTKPTIYVPEIIGIIILLYFTYRIIRKKGITGFLKTGGIA